MAENLAYAKRYNMYPGKTLGNYYLGRLSEQVETGPIFSARLADARTEQLYRLRFLALPAGLTAEERLLYLGHFQSEARRVAALQHSALLPLSDYGIFEGAPYLVSPDVPTISLQNVLANGGPLEAGLVVRYLASIAAALEYAHQQGVLHLNLNARTVFMSQDGRPLVAEVGLLRMLTPQMLAAPTIPQAPSELENGSPLLRDQRGKALYGLSLASAPAPELLLGQSPDPSSDVYALAALLYYLLTGHRILRGNTLAEIAHQHLHAAIPSLSVWRRDLPAALDQLLSSALAKDPAQRPRHPGAFANACAEIITPGQAGRRMFAIPEAAPLVLPPAPAAPQRAAFTSSSGQPTSFSRRRALTVIAVSGGVAATGITVWALAHTGNAGSSATSTGPTPTTQGSGSQGTAGGSGSSGHSGNVIASTSDVPVNSAKTFAIANSANPGILIHLQNNSFVAFNSTCTHAGCAVAYNQQSHLLECPCHGASFDPSRRAAVVGGPAPTPLSAIAITVNKDGTITTNG